MSAATSDGPHHRVVHAAEERDEPRALAPADLAARGQHARDQRRAPNRARVDRSSGASGAVHPSGRFLLLTGFFPAASCAPRTRAPCGATRRRREKYSGAARVVEVDRQRVEHVTDSRLVLERAHRARRPLQPRQRPCLRPLSAPAWPPWLRSFHSARRSTAAAGLPGTSRVGTGTTRLNVSMMDTRLLAAASGHANATYSRAWARNRSRRPWLTTPTTNAIAAVAVVAAPSAARPMPAQSYASGRKRTPATAHTPTTTKSRRRSRTRQRPCQPARRPRRRRWRHTGDRRLHTRPTSAEHAVPARP